MMVLLFLPIQYETGVDCFVRFRLKMWINQVRSVSLSTMFDQSIP